MPKILQTRLFLAILVSQFPIFFTSLSYGIKSEVCVLLSNNKLKKININCFSNYHSDHIISREKKLIRKNKLSVYVARLLFLK